MRATSKYRKMTAVYRYFAQDIPGLDWSEQALEAAFIAESYGQGKAKDIFDGSKNGFIVGKKLLNLGVTEWKEDMAKGLIFFWELSESIPPELRWWFDSVFSPRHQYAAVSHRQAQILRGTK